MAKLGKIKQPISKGGSKNLNEPKSPINSQDEKCLVFSFQHIQKNHCFNNCIAKEKVDLITSLFERRAMSWKEIVTANRHQLGSEKIARKSLSVTVPTLVPKDANIWALRFSNLAPMVGYYENNIFYIIWLDRSFTVYKH